MGHIKCKNWEYYADLKNVNKRKIKKRKMGLSQILEVENGLNSIYFFCQ
jgi:hypothetical protein